MPRTSERLRVIERKDSKGALTIVGTIRPIGGGEPIRVRQRAASNSRATAEQEAIELAHKILNNAWHGEKVGARTFPAAVTHYLKTSPRPPQMVRLIDRILEAMGGPVALAEINQEYVNKLREKLLKPDVKATSVQSQLITPLKAVINCAFKSGWCAKPGFEAPKKKKGEGKRTDFYMPGEALKLLAAAEPYFRLTLLGYLCAGFRLTELLTMDWAQVNLRGKTMSVLPEYAKNGMRRDAHIVPALLAALSAVPESERQGAVIRRKDGKPYLAYLNRDKKPTNGIKDRYMGGIENQLDTTIARAGIRRLTCHHLRHTWASWWYAANAKDLLGLKHEGGWENLSMVERYAHPFLVGYEDEIKAFWHERDTSLVSLVKNQYTSAA